MTTAERTSKQIKKVKMDRAHFKKKMTTMLLNKPQIRTYKDIESGEGQQKKRRRGGEEN